MMDVAIRGRVRCGGVRWCGGFAVGVRWGSVLWWGCGGVAVGLWVVDGSDSIAADSGVLYAVTVTCQNTSKAYKRSVDGMMQY